MMAIQFETMSQVRLVRGMPVVPCVEVHGVAFPGQGLRLQPPQQSASPPTTLLGWQGDQVIEIKNLAPSHCIHEPETGSRDDRIVQFDKDDPVSFFALNLPTADVLGFCQMWAQFTKSRPAMADVLVALCFMHAG
jgi:hypothetical protein